MKNMIYNYICIGLVFSTLVLLTGITFWGRAKPSAMEDCVPTEEIAIRIAKTISENKYSLSLGDSVCKVKFSEKDNEWIVWFSTKETLDDVITAGGGLPCVHINKNNAAITQIYLQK